MKQSKREQIGKCGLREREKTENNEMQKGKFRKDEWVR